MDMVRIHSYVNHGYYMKDVKMESSSQTTTNGSNADRNGVAPIIENTGQAQTNGSSSTHNRNSVAPPTNNRNSVAPSTHNQNSVSPVMVDEFRLYPKTKDPVRLLLYCDKLEYSAINSLGINLKPTVIEFDDVIGCHIMKGKDDADTNAYFTVYSYPFKNKANIKKRTRKRQTVTFTVNHFHSFVENFKFAELWRRGILLINRGYQGIYNRAIVSNTPLNAQKRYLVLVNPCSGPGKALQIFRERVCGILAEAEFHYHLIITERANHARDFVKNMTLGEFVGIVIVSGDGLIYEVINGLMERPDWEEAIKTPVGAVPGGSGNALCCALNHLAREPIHQNFILHSSFVLAKHKVIPMDLVAVQTQQQRIYSFLSIGWGIVADVDIESERFRSLGNARFTLVAIARIMGLRHYRGRVSYLPDENQPPSSKPRSQTESNVSKTTSGSGKSRRRSDGDDPTLNKGGLHHSESMPSMEIHNNSNRMVRSESMTTSNENTFERRVSTSESPESPGSEITKQLEDITEHLEEDTEEILEDNTFTPSDATDESEAVPTPLLPNMNDPVPSNWVTIEDNFVLVCACYQTHLNPDTFVAPDSTPNDGKIHLFMVKSGVSRSKLLGLMIEMEQGIHVDSPYIEYITCKAFRLEPLSHMTKGIMTVDGEVVDYGTIQAQVLPKLSRVMAKCPND